jgi:7-cyano-7-deazaguanosine (preQ0) biosynthesis protein QueE
MDIPLIVSEVFGPTIQGEGPSTGQQATFLRLAGCPLKCVWCDSAFSWDWSRYKPSDEIHKMSSTQVMEKLLLCGFPGKVKLLVITGGEPMAQSSILEEFLQGILEDLDIRVEIETSGVFPPLQDFYKVHYNVSPKLESSGNSKESRLKLPSLQAYLESQRAVFKFVITSEFDFKEIEEMQALVGIPDSMIWIQPEGMTREGILRSLQIMGPQVVTRGWNISPRLHTLIWGNRRGV